MTPQQAERAVSLLRGQMEAATKLATDGRYNDETYSADNIAAFVANAAAYRAAIAVLEAHAQPVRVVPVVYAARFDPSGPSWGGSADMSGGMWSRVRSPHGGLVLTLFAIFVAVAAMATAWEGW